MSSRAQTAIARIEIELGPAYPSGVLAPSGGAERRFAGWLELTSAIEEWVGEAAGCVRG